MSPEVVSKSRAADGLSDIFPAYAACEVSYQSDVYSLGLVMRSLVMRRHPPLHPYPPHFSIFLSPSHVADDKLRTLINLMLLPDPSHRPRASAAVAAAEKLLADEALAKAAAKARAEEEARAAVAAAAAAAAAAKAKAEAEAAAKAKALAEAKAAADAAEARAKAAAAAKAKADEEARLRAEAEAKAKAEEQKKAAAAAAAAAAKAEAEAKARAAAAAEVERKSKTSVCMQILGQVYNGPAVTHWLPGRYYGDFDAKVCRVRARDAW